MTVRKVSLIMNVFTVLFRWYSGSVGRGSRLNGIQIVLTGQPQSSGGWMHFCTGTAIDTRRAGRAREGLDDTKECLWLLQGRCVW